MFRDGKYCYYTLSDGTKKMLPRGYEISFKRWKLEDLKAKIIIIIEKVSKRDNSWAQYLTIEDLAFELRAKHNMINKVLMELNREGYIHQPTRKAPHDSGRDGYWTGGSESLWCSDTWYLRGKNGE